MRRIDRERRQQWEDVREEMLFQPIALRFFKVASLHKRHVCGSECWSYFLPAFLLIGRELRDRFSNPGQLLGRGQSIRTLRQNALPQLALETGDAHHEKFVKIVGGNRQKPHTFEQRMMLVGRLFEHSPIEMKPRQLTVDEPFRA